MISSETRDLCFEIRNKYSELHILICKHLTDTLDLSDLVNLKQQEIKKIEEHFHEMVGISS